MYGTLSCPHRQPFAKKSTVAVQPGRKHLAGRAGQVTIWQMGGITDGRLGAT